MSRFAKLALGVLGGGATIAAALYAAYAGITWYRYGRPNRCPTAEESDSLLDLYMPEYEVAERHHIQVHAPAETTFAAACGIAMSQSAPIRILIRTRELVLSFAAAAKWGLSPLRQIRNQQEGGSQINGLVAELKARGWGVLAEIPGREIVLGTVTQPWIAETVFRAVPPAEFRDFHEPGYVKIAVTLCADPVSPFQSKAWTETRVMTTDPVARARFRRYWSLVAPGAILIRKILLRNLKTEAEGRVIGKRTIEPVAHSFADPR